MANPEPEDVLRDGASLTLGVTDSEGRPVVYARGVPHGSRDEVRRQVAYVYEAGDQADRLGDERQWRRISRIRGELRGAVLLRQSHDALPLAREVCRRGGDHAGGGGGGGDGGGASNGTVSAAAAGGD